MIIRKAVFTDREQIREVHLASIRRLCANRYTPEQVAAWTQILVPSIYDQALNEKIFRVACDHQKTLAGMGILDVENGEISAVYIHPDCIGKGIGSALLCEFERIARDCNIFELVVHSTLNARGFYNARGYGAQALTSHKLPNGLELECIRMVKALNA